MIRKNLTFLFLVFTFILSCKKNIDENSHDNIASQIIVSSFKTLLNGNLWLADSTYCLLQIDSLNQFQTFSAVGLDSNNIIVAGFVKYGSSTNIPLGHIGLAPTIPGALLEYYPIENGDTLTQCYILDGSITITFNDPTQRLVSGKFESSFINLITPDTIIIKNGEFINLHYNFVQLIRG